LSSNLVVTAIMQILPIVTKHKNQYWFYWWLQNVCQEKQKHIILYHVHSVFSTINFE
jgi:hypothetical protein